MARIEVAVLVPIAFSVGLGCSTTAGSTWVSQPEPGPFAGEDLAFVEGGLDAFDEPAASAESRDLEVEGRPQARPRLDRTVTLGEVHTGYTERSAEAAPGAAPISVTVNNYVATPPSYYAAPAFAGDFRRGDDPRPSKPIARPTQPGQNWPALPSYGPAFPFKTAPASPWAPAR